VAVRGGPLGAVGVQVDLRQSVHEAPHPRAEEVAKGLRNDPRQGRVIAALQLVMAGVEHRMHHHGDQRDGFQRGEEAADGEPVFRGTDPEIVVTEAENAGTEHQRNFDIQPGLDNLAAHAQGLDQAVGIRQPTSTSQVASTQR